MEVKDEKLSLGRAQEKKFKAHDTSQYPVVAEVTTFYTTFLFLINLIIDFYFYDF